MARPFTLLDRSGSMVQIQPSPISSANLPLGTAAEAEAAYCVLARLTGHARIGSGSVPFTSRPKEQNALAQARLGAAAGLFVALRGKHGPTASHCLRVSLLCSAWGENLGLEESERNCLEVAALLHDVGKIAVPDVVLFKPRSLAQEERRAMDQKHACATEILLHCGINERVLQIMLHGGLWYGRRIEGAPSGEEISLAGRILHIVDAYDSMTSDHIYRTALPVEAALEELRRGAGTQFDPGLVTRFQDGNFADSPRWMEEAAQRWLRDYRPGQSLLVSRAEPSSSIAPATPAPLTFFSQLIDNSTDGVFFVKQNRQVVYWNPALERITGLKSEQVLGSSWDPSLLELADQRGRRHNAETCPILHNMNSRASLRLLASVKGLARRVPVRLEIRAVLSDQNEPLGVAVQLHDLSGEAVLQEQYEDMRQKASRDPLTNLANRAEMDRQHKANFELHRASQSPYSLIICDIDRFKRINDNFGHHAGDEAIRVFGRILTNHSDAQDCVARYGGEEFVLLCGKCEETEAVARAEQIRQFLSEQPIAALGGNCITASFGVAELLPGDTAETMLRRADRALLHAKESGRNRVISFGREESAEQGSSWFQPRKETAEGDLTWRWQLLSPTPVDIVVGKLRGFVADHRAEIKEVRENFLRLLLYFEREGDLRRILDRKLALQITIELVEAGEGTTHRKGLLINVTVQLFRPRDRRRDDLQDIVQRVHQSLKSYLVAEDYRSEA